MQEEKQPNEAFLRERVRDRPAAIRLSIVIPAYNEQAYLPRCLESARSALRACETLLDDPEIIVCDNDSDDRTPDIAREHGAAVAFEPYHQIGRVRNTGATVATGDWLLFIDADSILETDTLRIMLETVRSGGIIGGGCLVGMDGELGFGRFLVSFWNLLSRTMRWAAGSFIFCRADAFREIGGFGPDYYAGEEIDLTRKLKALAKQRREKFVILKGSRHVSSSRKFRLYSRREQVMTFLRLAFFLRRTVRSRRHLDYFYDGRR